MTQATAKPFQPEIHRVPAKNPSAKLQRAELLRLAGLCMLQGAKAQGVDAKMALSNLLCSGLETRTYSSVVICGYVEPKELKFRSDPKEIYPHLDYPMNSGGVVQCYDKYEYEEHYGAKSKLHVYNLDYTSLRIGLARLSLDYPHIFADWLNDRDDALTGDALVQCALFGGLVYG